MNESIQIHDFQVINDKVLLVRYKLRDKSNIFIAAMTTCHACLTFYREIAHLGDRVLYFDTDSIVFISRPGEYEPKLGEFLGEFTDELGRLPVIEVIEPRKITRNRSRCLIYNRSQTKQYRKVYDKRVFLANYETVPYGY